MAARLVGGGDRLAEHHGTNMGCAQQRFLLALTKRKCNTAGSGDVGVVASAIEPGPVLDVVAGSGRRATKGGSEPIRLPGPGR